MPASGWPVIVFGHDFNGEVCDAEFFAGNDIENGVSGADESFEFGLKVHELQ